MSWDQVSMLSMISIHAPLAGSDGQWRNQKSRADNFNPRSPCGERLYGVQFGIFFNLFQSTLPLRGATAPGGPPE